MTNEVLCGKVIEFANTGSAIASGAVVVVGERIGVAVAAIAATTGSGSVQMEGVFTLAKDTSTAVTQGQKLFWDTTSSKLVAVPSATAKIAAGYAAAAAATSDATCDVRLDNIPKRGAAVADGSTVNQLLAALRAAGIIET